MDGQNKAFPEIIPHKNTTVNRVNYRATYACSRWSLLKQLNVFCFCQLGGPEMALGLKDEPKASDFGFYLGPGGGRYGAVCPESSQMLICCIAKIPQHCSWASASNDGRGLLSGKWSRSLHGTSVLPCCSFPPPEAEGYMAFLENKLPPLFFFVYKMGIAVHFLNGFEVSGWKRFIVTTSSFQWVF